MHRSVSKGTKDLLRFKMPILLVALRATLNLRKFKVALKPMYVIFLNFAAYYASYHANQKLTI